MNQSPDFSVITVRKNIFRLIDQLDTSMGGKCLTLFKNYED